MALTDARPDAAAPPWTAPRWPTVPPDPARTSGAYNPLADEFVLRFGGTGGRHSVVMLIKTPDAQDINVLADDETGERIGVQIDNLRFRVITEHPSWRALAKPEPPVPVVADLLAEAKRRFARYGAGETPPAVAPRHEAAGARLYREGIAPAGRDRHPQSPVAESNARRLRGPARSSRPPRSGAAMSNRVPTRLRASSRRTR